MSNIRAFLDMLAWSEGTSTHRKTKCNGYDVIVSGVSSPQTFTDFSRHPNVLVLVNKSGLKSTAAGRYQLLYRYWVAYCKQLGLSDFTPETQDKIAIQQIKERKALRLIEEGHLAEAIKRCANIWASLPGNDYGQPQHSYADLERVYVKSGGTLA